MKLTVKIVFNLADRSGRHGGSMSRLRGARVCLVAALVLTPALAARADEAALQKRIEELEAQQREVLEQLKSMQKELQAERQRDTAAPVPVAAPLPAPAVPVPAASAPAAAQAPAVQAAPAAPVAGEAGRVGEVERRQGILTDEIRKIREFLVLPETQELKSYYGLGPAASKVYGIPRGLSIGGYGESNFNKITSDANGANSTFDFVRLVTYIGYKFTDQIVFNSEIEYEHASTGSTVSSSDGEVALELATLDYLYAEALNARGGLMLVPMGFINEVHEPPFYLGNTRPPVETQIIPTTWSSNGVGLFGQPFEGLEYKLYGVTSFNAKGYRSINLRDARQGGNREIANDWSFVGRGDYAILPEWSAGGSMYLGDQGQGEEYGNEDIGFRKVGAFTQIYEVHSEVLTRGFEFRILGTTAFIDDAAILSQDEEISLASGGQPIGEVLLGIYGEAAYNVLPLIWSDTTQYLAPWFRYTWLDTNNKVPSGFTRNKAARRDYFEFGLQYKPIPQVVLKVDYHIQDSEAGTLPDELRLGGGFVF